MTGSKAKRVLIAEDDPGDVFLLQRAFSTAGVSASLHFVRDGQEAIDYLGGEASFADRTAYPLPELMLLDLKMPRLNGFDVLEWLRKQPGLRRLLVNAAYWCTGLTDKIDGNADVTYVGEYKPLWFGFGKFAKGIKPDDIVRKSSP